VVAAAAVHAAHAARARRVRFAPANIKLSESSEHYCIHMEISWWENVNCYDATKQQFNISRRRKRFDRGEIPLI
jgi:hypothetical protein